MFNTIDTGRGEKADLIPIRMTPYYAQAFRRRVRQALQVPVGGNWARCGAHGRKTRSSASYWPGPLTAAAMKVAQSPAAQLPAGHGQHGQAVHTQ